MFILINSRVALNHHKLKMRIHINSLKLIMIIMINQYDNLQLILPTQLNILINQIRTSKLKMEINSTHMSQSQLMREQEIQKFHQA